MQLVIPPRLHFVVQGNFKSLTKAFNWPFHDCWDFLAPDSALSVMYLPVLQYTTSWLRRLELISPSL